MLASARARYRKLAATAAQDAAPVLATLAPAQIAALERRFAENNRKFETEYLASDDDKRRRAQARRMLDRFRDFAGDLTPEQEARIERFVLEHEKHVALRFDDRRQLQRDFVAALRQRHGPRELGASLADIFDKPELRRSEAFIREDRAWDEDLGRLIVELDRTLSPDQRVRVVQRLSDYAKDFAALAGERKEAA